MLINHPLVRPLKLALKKNKYTYRYTLDLYFQLQCLKADSFQLLRKKIFFYFLGKAEQQKIVVDYMAYRIVSAYQAGDDYFNVGRPRPAFRKWQKSLSFQQKAVKKFYPEFVAGKFIYLRSYFWTINIGHICFLDYFIKLSLLGLLPRPKLRLYCTEKQVANDYYLKKYAPYLEIIKADYFTDDQRELEVLDQKLNIIETKKGPLFLYHACLTAEMQWAAAKRQPLLALSDDERQAGFAILSKLGLKENAWYVALHVRGHRYHNDQLDNTRNAQLGDYELAIQKIIDTGGQIVLLGEAGADMPPAIKDKVIDYANSELRSKSFDIFVCAACRFFIGTSSGISHVSGTYGVPAIFANLSPSYSRPWKANDIWIPKLLWCHARKRYLSYREMMQPPYCLLDTKTNQGLHNIVAYDNAPEDICDAVTDMLLWLATGQSHDSRLQDYVNRMDPTKPPYPYPSRLSPSFARRHRKILMMPDEVFDE